VKAIAFDAYGTLFDVFSVTALGEELFPGKGDALAQLWRVKQLQYSTLRSLMGRHIGTSGGSPRTVLSTLPRASGSISRPTGARACWRPT
jgi:HAD superfamily hydrolase (TIGR01493 family)